MMPMLHEIETFLKTPDGQMQAMIGAALVLLAVLAVILQSDKLERAKGPIALFSIGLFCAGTAALWFW